ncbi:unnamed protein product [Spirodela intermedia]|uniref:Uncharacterized protein n=1 Tax=Spirodela intermedia TaxID=51605 RepID=A0A7I8L2J5_SPIIN|nr:unnamed protein product [Spirodela intermedia]
MEGIIPLVIRAFRKNRKRSKYRCLSKNPNRAMPAGECEDGGDQYHHYNSHFVWRSSSSSAVAVAGRGYEDFPRRYPQPPPPPPRGFAPSRSVGHGGAALPPVLSYPEELRRTKSGSVW